MTDEDWFDDEDRAIAQRFRDLKTAIATLENVQVWITATILLDLAFFASSFILYSRSHSC